MLHHQCLILMGTAKHWYTDNCFMKFLHPQFAFFMTYLCKIPKTSPSSWLRRTKRTTPAVCIDFEIQNMCCCQKDILLYKQNIQHFDAAPHKTKADWINCRSLYSAFYSLFTSRLFLELGFVFWIMMKVSGCKQREPKSSYVYAKQCPPRLNK